MITDPKAIKFTMQARRVANLMGQLRRTLEELDILVVTDFEDVTGGAADGDIVNDAEVSTQPVSKLNVAQYKYRWGQVKAALTQDDGEAVVALFANNTIPLI